MRLGGYFKASTIQQLMGIVESLDTYGLSCIQAPGSLAAMDDDECTSFGQKAQSLGIVIGECGMWQNMMSSDGELQSKRVELLRAMLKKADLMGCRSVVSCVGSKDKSDNHLAPHPYMYTDDCKAEFREVVLRVLDGLDLSNSRYIIEPWHNTFFYRPEEIAAFFESVDHPAFGLHLDQMNMVRPDCFYDTTTLMRQTFYLLSDYVVSVHLKDVACDYRHMFMKYDEVNIGDGVMDYDTYLKLLSDLDPDIPCYCEHMDTEAEYALNFARLHRRAAIAGTEFRPRG